MRTILVSVCLLSMAWIAPVQAAMITRDSLDFQYAYEMDTDVTTMSLDTNSAYDWDQMPSYTPTGKTSVSFDGGIMTMPDVSCLASGHNGASNQLWPYADLDVVNTGFTIEMGIKVLSQSGAEGITGAFTFFLSPASGGAFRAEVGANRVNVYDGTSNPNSPTLVTAYSGNNTDAFHSYRIARNADTDGGKWWFWRDDVLLTPNGISKSTDHALDCMYVGAAVSSSTAGVSEVDYIRFDKTGAYAPTTVPEPSTIVLLLAGFSAVWFWKRK